jgi:hypothetical protein
VNASGHSDVYVCVTAKPWGLRRRGIQGVTLGHPVGPARAGHLEVGGLLPEGDALPEGEGAPRRGVLSSGVDRLIRARLRPLRCALNLKRLWESVHKWNMSPLSSVGAERARPAAPSTNTGIIRGGESSPNM